MNENERKSTFLVRDIFERRKKIKIIEKKKLSIFFLEDKLPIKIIHLKHHESR